MVLNKKEELKKNKLDMQFRSLSQRLNVILTLGTVGILSFVGVFIWHKERLTLGFFMVMGILLLLCLWYYSVKQRMNSLLKEIERI